MDVHVYENGTFTQVIDGSFFEVSSLVGRFVASHNPGEYARLDVVRGVGADRVSSTYEIAAGA